ncbi:zinc ABC transporter substrate-binding protein [Tissierella praeacuta]|uniref:metal ABC transporter solute-binding protein, Zn/Mn family n=1 Tax=Tissierella praeacuta TaxID=43131 RepID=UPI00334090C6
MKKILSLIMVLSIIMVVLTGCGSQGKSIEDNKYKVVATTTLVADLVKSIGGEYVNVQGLMGPGVDPHLYKASAGDVTVMQNADMVVYNGIHLEGKMGEIFENIEDSKKMILAVSQDMDESNFIDFVTNPGSFDPHIWFDVRLWKEAAKTVTEGLKELDKEHASEFDSNLENYLIELDELDGYIRQRVSELAEENRILITAHDAFHYFGNAYGFEVKGLQGISTASEAGTSDVSQLAKFIVEHKIKAVFVESSVPRKSIEALQEAVRAQGFQVEIGGELYSDSTGDIGTDAETYIGTFKANIDIIVDALK